LDGCNSSQTRHFVTGSLGSLGEKPSQEDEDSGRENNSHILFAQLPNHSGLLNYHVSALESSSTPSKTDM